MDGKQLKNSILQWAIQGKLVPQDPNDEPAIELLHRINPQIRPITEDTPFDIPKSWCWCKMGNVMSLLSGRDLEPSKYNNIGNGIPYITGASHFNNGCLIVNRWTEKPITISNLGDLLITCKGTIGAMAFNKIGEIHIARQVMAISSSFVNLEYIKAFLSFNVSALEAQAKSMIPGISRDILLNALIPIPPLAEQQRIVARIEELMPLVERYAQAQASLDKLNGDIKDKLKKSILQEAIQGKLIPQDPNDEPAIELLHRINPSFTPPQYDEPLPQGWSVATMSMLCSLIDGEKIQGKEMINLDAKYLRGQQDGTVLKSGKYIPANSLIILVDGENSGEVFRAPIDGYQGSTFKKLVIDANMYEEYILQVINSHRSKLRGNKVGAAIPHLNKRLFREILVPIPPLAEQKRIVARIEELFAIVENIKS